MNPLIVSWIISFLLTVLFIFAASVSRGKITWYEILIVGCMPIMGLIASFFKALSIKKSLNLSIKVASKIADFAMTLAVFVCSILVIVSFLPADLFIRLLYPLWFAIVAVIIGMFSYLLSRYKLAQYWFDPY